MENITFKELGLKDEILQAIDQLGFESPSPIQAQTVPVALEGSDIVGLSQTGSGKTAAFTLPLLQKLDLKKRRTQVLILCPTRELCLQVCEEVHRLGACMKELHAVPVYGGAPIHRQVRALEDGAHMVVGTPGRVMDMLDRGCLRTENILMTVLDEADRMLDMGFRDDMEELLNQLPGERQTLFFSATMNKGVEGLIRRFGKDPKRISIERKTLTVSSIEQVYYEVRNRSKIEVVSRVLDMDPPRLAVIFCNTKKMVDDCTEALVSRGYMADKLHGDVTQFQRERTINRFREGKVEILVATDVAARGLDVENVDVVFNYDLPYDAEDYVHRIGRTGRAGRSGKAVSFVFGRDIYRLQSIERYTRQTMKRCRIPTQDEVEGRRADKIFNAAREILEKGDFQPYDELVDRLLDQGHTPTDIANTLFTMLHTNEKRDSESIKEDHEPWDENPRRRGGGRRRDGDRDSGGDRRGRGGDGGGREWRGPRDKKGGKGGRRFNKPGFKGKGGFKKDRGGDRGGKGGGGYKKNHD